MAAPTNVRAESNSETTVVLSWTYGGTGQISVYRALHGGSFSLVAIVATATLTYTDLNLATATYYDYKLSDDAGSTFSSVVSVTTQACPQLSGSTTGLTLPRADGDRPSAPIFDEAMTRLETVNQTQITNANPCASCPSNGAIVLDCTSGCSNFVIDATSDINSISINSCDSTGTITFNVPPNTTRRICGWPAGVGFTGDECFQAPIVTGADGRSVVLSYGGVGGNRKIANSPSSNGYGPASHPTQVCTCIPGTSNQLTIKSCTANNSLCQGTTKQLVLKACGGKPPYSWTHSGSVAFSKPDGTTTNTATGSQVTVVPPTNTGSGTAGTAYTAVIISCYCGLSGSCTDNCGDTGTFVWTDYGCNDQAISTSASNTTGDPTGCGPTFGTCKSGSCACATCKATSGGCFGIQCYPNQPDALAQNTPVTQASTCDKRTGPMIAAGCNPCGTSGAGQTVTVTDALGVSVSIVLRN